MQNATLVKSIYLPFLALVVGCSGTMATGTNVKYRVVAVSSTNFTHPFYQPSFNDLTFWAYVETTTHVGNPPVGSTTLEVKQMELHPHLHSPENKNYFVTGEFTSPLNSNLVVVIKSLPKTIPFAQANLGDFTHVTTFPIEQTGGPEIVIPVY